MAGLTERQRLIIQLHYADGWSIESIAKAIGVTQQSVSRSHVVALKRLSSCISRASDLAHVVKLQQGK